MTQGIGGGAIITVFYGNAGAAQRVVFCILHRSCYLAPDQ